MTGLDANTRFSIWVSASAPHTVAKYRMAYFADTVFPAPDSPDTMIDWFSSNLEKQKDGKVRELDFECDNISGGRFAHAFSSTSPTSEVTMQNVK
jgi:hypothetical protein